MLLFVDDNKSLLHVLSRSFSEHYDVVGFSNSGDAIEYMSEHEDKLDIILSDYKMPNFNGIQVLEKAKQTKTETIRILLTGYVDIDDIRVGKPAYDVLIDKNTLKDTQEIIKIIKDITLKKNTG